MKLRNEETWLSAVYVLRKHDLNLFILNTNEIAEKKKLLKYL